MQLSSAKKRFQRFNLLTILSLFLVILAGGIVRSTGSGMGCPDWPKCFDQYIPPTHISQLPPDYKEKFVEGRVQKNIRFARSLDILGYSNLADKIRHDESILLPEEFNASKTWTEYINRLVGAFTGIVMLITAICSFSYRKLKPPVFYWSIFNVFLVGFQGWLGSIVVSTNLVAWIVTVHMLIALAIVAIAIYTYHLVRPYRIQDQVKVKLSIWLTALVAFISSIAQIIIGTEVREQIDEISSRLNGDLRSEWVVRVGELFHEHRDFALWILLINIILYAMLRKRYSRNSLQQQIMSFSLIILLLQLLSGVALSSFSLPPFAQAAHIVLGSLMFAAQFYLLLNLRNNIKSIEG
jgi:cytochrome c oxidase assembly protein subunit 15